MTLGARTVLLYPLFHPAASLHPVDAEGPRGLLAVPTLLDRAADSPPADEPEPASTFEPEPVQLGLF